MIRERGYPGGWKAWFGRVPVGRVPDRGLGPRPAWRSGLLVKGLLLSGLILSVFVPPHLLALQDDVVPTAGSARSWRVETVEGSVLDGTGLRVAGGVVSFVEGGDAAVPLDRVLAIRSGHDRGPERGDSGTVRVVLLNGGTLWGEVTGLSPDGLRLKGPAGELEFGLEDVAAVVWRDSSVLRGLLDTPSADSDRIVATGGEGSVVVAGLFEGFDGERISLQYEGQSRTIPVARLEALVPARLGTPDAAAAPARVELVEGGWAGGRLESIGEESMELAIGQRTIRLPVESVAAVLVASDRVAFLADLEPLRVESEVQFAPARPWQRNRSVAGNPIRLTMDAAGTFRQFESGLGTRSGIRLVYANGGRFDRLVGQVGIDVETAGRGDCVARVRGDGIELWSARLQGGKPAVAYEIGIAGLAEIELEVLPGEQFDLADHVDWAGIRMVRTRDD